MRNAIMSVGLYYFMCIHIFATFEMLYITMAGRIDVDSAMPWRAQA